MAPPVPMLPTVNCLPDLFVENCSGEAFIAASLARTAADALTGVSFFFAETLRDIVTAGGFGIPPSLLATGFNSACGAGLRLSSRELRGLVAEVPGESFLLFCTLIAGTGVFVS